MLMNQYTNFSSTEIEVTYNSGDGNFSNGGDDIVMVIVMVIMMILFVMMM
jgi:hypothetical protein